MLCTSLIGFEEQYKSVLIIGAVPGTARSRLDEVYTNGVTSELRIHNKQFKGQAAIVRMSIYFSSVGDFRRGRERASWAAMLHRFKRCSYSPIFSNAPLEEGQTLAWRQVLAEFCLLRSPPANLLTATLFAAQDVESVTACQNRVGTYMARSCDGVEVHRAVLCLGKPNSESGIGGNNEVMQ